MSSAVRFWSALYEIVYRCYLLEAHSQRSASIERWVNAVVAITSTTSLGIWAVFKSYPQVWASIIVGTQIVSAISKFLPFTERVKASSACAHEYREIKNWAEAKWCEIADGNLTVAQINKARAELQTKISKADKAHFPRAGLPNRNELNNLATAQAEQYLVLHYGENNNGKQ